MSIDTLLKKNKNKKLYTKIKYLIKYVWNVDLDKDDIDTWLDNFKTNDEKELALEILSNFNYYNESEIESLMKAGFEMLKNKINLEYIQDNQQIRFENLLDDCYFIGTWETPGKSGKSLLYKFRNMYENLAIDNFPTELARVPDDAKYIIFFDDVAGTGRQLEGYWRKIVLAEKTRFKNAKFFYLVLVGTEEGIKHIEKTTSMPVLSVVRLNERFKAFSDKSTYFSSDDRRDFAKRVCTKYGKVAHPSAPTGFANSQLLLGFHHNIPDNTLPIIWSNENGWKPIFPRNELTV